MMVETIYFESLKNQFKYVVFLHQSRLNTNAGLPTYWSNLNLSFIKQLFLYTRTFRPKYSFLHSCHLVSQQGDRRRTIVFF